MSGRVERRPAALVAAAVAIGIIAGAALGVMWWSLAPRVSLVVRPDDTFPEGYQPREWITADVVFALLAVAAGVIATVALVAMRRGHLIAVLGAAVLAGGIGTAAMRIVGERLGSVDIAGLQATLPSETIVDAPLQVTMPAVLLAWPIAAAVVVTVVALGDVLAQRRSRIRQP